MRGLAPGRRRRQRCGLLVNVGLLGRRRHGSPNVLRHSGAEAYPVTTDEPMMASMAGRYAAALFELAKEQGIPTYLAADRLAERRIEQVAQLKRTYI